MVIVLSIVALAGPLKQDQVSALADKLLPMVEEASGRTFQSTPQVVLARPRQYHEALAAEMRALATVFDPDVTRAELWGVGLGARIQAEALVGKLGLFDGVVYVNPDGIERIVAEAKRSRLDVDNVSVAECVLAHELTHALQLQSGSFEHVAQARDREWFTALNAVSEGHAVIVHEAVCRKLGHERVLPLLRETLGFDETDSLSPYVAGTAFLEHHREQVWTVLESPPISTHALFHPDTYEPAAEPPLPIHVEESQAAALVIANTPGATARTHRLGYLDLLSQFGPHQRTRQALLPLVQASTSQARAGTGAISVSVLEFHEAKAADEFAQVACGVAEATEATPTVIPTYFDQLEPLVGLHAHRTCRHRFTARPSNLGTLAARVTTVVAQQDAAVLVVRLSQVDRRSKRLVPAINTLLAAVAAPH